MFDVEFHREWNRSAMEIEPYATKLSNIGRCHWVFLSLMHVAVI